MKVAFRADASVTLGAGHVMRCLTLADALRADGAQTRFLCRNLPGHLGDLIQARGHVLRWLDVPADAEAVADAEATRRALAVDSPWDWLVADHYALDAEWERAQHGLAGRILAIDDLADRRHACDLLLDQNLKPDNSYEALIPLACRSLIGPSYALLRPEFARARRALPAVSVTVQRLLLCFGGSDPLDLTGLALDALDSLDDSGARVDVVVGQGYPHRARLQARCAARPGTSFHCQTENMAELMARADLALGASGVATWERACLGLPALVITFADNQRPIARAAEAAGLLAWAGDAESMSRERLAAALAGLLAAPERRAAMHAACLERVDGEGCARVLEAMRR